jgi:hypothetical protein
MKLFRSFVALVAAAACSPVFAQNPDLAVYRASYVTREIQGDVSGTKKTKRIEIVDLVSGDSVEISLSKPGTSKTFFTGPTNPHMLTTVSDTRTPKVKEYAVLGDAFRGISQEVDAILTRVLKGKKVPLVLRGSTPSNVAKVLTGNATALFADAALFESALVLKLDLALSKTINDADETMAQAVERVEALLVAEGYVKQNPQVF